MQYPTLNDNHSFLTRSRGWLGRVWVPRTLANTAGARRGATARGATLQHRKANMWVDFLSIEGGVCFLQKAKGIRRDTFD